VCRRTVGRLDEIALADPRPDRPEVAQAEAAAQDRGVSERSSCPGREARGAAVGALDPAFFAAVQPNIILAAALVPKTSAADFGVVQVLRTDQVGMVQLLSNGKTVTLE